MIAFAPPTRISDLAVNNCSSEIAVQFNLEDSTMLVYASRLTSSHFNTCEHSARCRFASEVARSESLAGLCSAAGVPGGTRTAGAFPTRCSTTVVIPSKATTRWRRSLIGIASEPILDHLVIKLLAPEQPSISLARDVRCFFAACRRNAFGVEGWPQQCASRRLDRVAESWLFAS